MRKLFFTLLALFPLATLATTPRTVTLAVHNMTCPITLKKSLGKVADVNAVQIDFDKKTVAVTYDPDKAQLASLTEATTSAGYPSTVQE